MTNNPFADLIDQIKASQPKDPNLARRLNELISLNELVTALHTTRSTEEVLTVLLLTVLGEYPCSKGAILINTADGWQIGAGKGLKKNALDCSALPREDDCRHLPPIIREGDPTSAKLSTLLADKLFSYIFPMRAEERLVGMICLGKGLLGKLEDEKAQLIKNVALFGGVVIGNALNRQNLEKINRRLQRNVFQLNNLYEIASAFARCYENTAVYQVLANNLMGQFFISRSGVLDCTGRLVFSKGVKAESDVPVLPLSELEQLITLDRHRAIEIDDLNCEVFQDFLKNQKIHYLFPIAGEAQHYGFLLLGNRMNRKALTDEDMDFIISLAQQAAVALENVVLQQEVLEKKRMERELALAREIQQRLLPKKIPTLAEYEIAVEMRPYQQVGGDFYDLIPLENGLLAICIADVSGKSLPASMIMSTTQASLRALTSFKNKGALEVIEKLNWHICNSTQSNKYVTMFYAVLDPTEHTLTYINAGHNRPLFLTPDGNIRELDKGGMVIGLFPTAKYQTETIDFPEGAELLIFTDGLSEIADAEGEEFGEERLQSLMSDYHGHDCADTCKNKIVEHVLKFGAGQMIDDLTILYLRRSKKK